MYCIYSSLFGYINSLIECHFCISQGGVDAQKSWPRLAEYFARYQLSLDLSCSLEVLAPSLCRRPLMIRPSLEMERRVKLINAMKDDKSDADQNEWAGYDGFDNEDENTENTNVQMPQVSKAVKEREQAEQEKKKKIALLCKAAEMYKGRPVSLKNVALEMHPIRKHGENAHRAKNCSMLEVSIAVFGSEPDCSDSDNESVHREYPQSRVVDKSNKSAALQLVRMVNGVPLLDSPEAVACGLVQKISNNASSWNSFGLDVSLKQLKDSSDESFRDDSPVFAVEDSAQVAPFFRETAHGLFHGRHCDSDQSSDEESFDPENRNRKRKKERNGLHSLLPAALRLGEMMMIVQIRAKPSALPLPTLSKVCTRKSCLLRDSLYQS